MYTIKLNNRKMKNMCFFTYEEARSAVRKILRKDGRAARYSNPCILGSGYTIVKMS